MVRAEQDMKLYSHFLWSIAVAAVAFVSFEAGMFLREARLKLDETAGQLQGLVRPTQQLEANWSATAVISSQVLAKERVAFESQQAYYADLSTKTSTLLGTANDTLSQFNGSILPKIYRDLDSGNTALVAAGDAIERVAGTSEETIREVQPLLTELEPAARNFSEMSAHAAGTSANLEATTADIKDYVHRNTRPVRGTYNLLKELLGLGYQARGLLGY